jgi:transposase
MDTIGLDLHKRESQLCVLAPDGTARQQRILTSRERFTAVLGPIAPATVLLEASTESEWVPRHLETLGHAVIVADPNYAPMYATHARRVKTDRRDARTLAEACRLGPYRRLARRKGRIMARALIAKELASIVYWVLRKQEAFNGKFRGHVLTPKPAQWPRLASP